MKNILILGWGISGKGAAALARELGKNPIPVDSAVPADPVPNAVFGWKDLQD